MNVLRHRSHVGRLDYPRRRAVRPMPSTVLLELAGHVTQGADDIASVLNVPASHAANDPEPVYPASARHADWATENDGAVGCEAQVLESGRRSAANVPAAHAATPSACTCVSCVRQAVVRRDRGVEAVRVWRRACRARSSRRRGRLERSCVLSMIREALPAPVYPASARQSDSVPVQRGCGNAEGRRCIPLRCPCPP